MNQLDRRAEFERRLLALVRHKLDMMDEDYPNGYEIDEFVVAFKFFQEPAPDDEIDAWAGGAYPGWWPSSSVVGSSPAWWIDEQLLRDALEWATQQRQESERTDDSDDEDADSD